VDASLLAVLARNASHDLVKFMVEVVEYLDGWEVLLVQRLPGVNTNPSRAVLYSDPRHVDSVLCGSQSSFLVGVTDRAEEAAHNLVVGLELAVVGCLFKHAQM
jgi:hypothetical protein